MNKSKIFIMIAMAAIVLLPAMTSCDSIIIETEDEQTELRFTSGIESLSRAAYTATDTLITNGDSIFVYVDSASTARPLYEKIKLTSNGNGGLSGVNLMYWPVTGNLDIYALHTNATLSGNTYPTTILTHTVNTEQTSLAAYARSDLLYAKSPNVVKTPGAVNLTFYHLLSKLQVAVRIGEGLTAADITGLTIGGTKPEATFTLAKTTAANAVAITAAGTVSTMTIGRDISTDFTTDNIRYNEAIIVPQTLTANTVFITVKLSAGGDLVYRIPAGGITFQSGKKYEYQITATRQGLTLTATISNWTPVGPVTGNATVQ